MLRPTLAASRAAFGIGNIQDGIGARGIAARARWPMPAQGCHGNTEATHLGSSIKADFQIFFKGWNPPYLAWASPQTKPCLKDTLCQESWEQAPCVSLKGPKHPSKDEGSQGPAPWIPCAAESILKAPKIRQMINFWHCRCPLLSEQTHWSQYCS